MDYVIKFENGDYLTQNGGRFHSIKGLGKAIKGDERKMKNIHEKCLNSTMRSKCKIVELNEPFIVGNNAQINESPSLIDELANSLNSLINNDICTYKKSLQQDLDNVTAEICDINHYIEFFNLDASKGFKIYKMLQQRLTRRRAIKDELEKIEIIFSSTVNDIISGRLNDRLNGLANRQYSPRVLTELFEK